MLAELYIEALLVDEDLADQVWELWNAGVMTDDLATHCWATIWRRQLPGGDDKPSIISAKETIN